MKLSTRIGICTMLLISHAALWAQSVGRTEVKHLPDGWSQLTKFELKGLALDGGMKHMSMEGAAFLNKTRNMLLVVESTTGGNSSRVNWVSMKCPSVRAGYYTNDYGANQNSRDSRCLVVNTKYSDKNYLATVSAPTAAAVEKEGLRFDKGHLIRTWVGNPGGTYVKVYLFKTSALETELALNKHGESGVDQSLIDFGELLQKTVNDSVLSMSGNLSLQLLNTVK